MTEGYKYIPVCGYCDQAGGCNYSGRHSGEQPKLKVGDAGKDAVELKRGALSIGKGYMLVSCFPYRAARGAGAGWKGRVKGIQREMCAGFEDLSIST